MEKTRILNMRQYFFKHCNFLKLGKKSVLLTLDNRNTFKSHSALCINESSLDLMSYS